MGTAPPVPPASPTHGESHQVESAESSSHINVQLMAVAPMSSWTYEGGRVLVTFEPCGTCVLCNKGACREAWAHPKAEQEGGGAGKTPL